MFSAVSLGRRWPTPGDREGLAVRPPGVHFLTFCTEEFRSAAQGLIASAERLGFFSSVKAISFEDIAVHDFIGRRSWIRPTVRGCGFYAWKPYIIRETLSLVPAGDVVVYWDAGRGAGNAFLIPPRRIVSSALRSGGSCPGVLVPQYGANRCWTHRACFDAIGASEEAAYEGPQIQATFSIWQHHPTTLAFLDQWLEFCGDISVVGDADATQPDEFVGHRHDQSVCTLLARKHSRQPIHLTKPAIEHVVCRRRRIKDAFKDMNFVELALTEGTGLVALAYKAWKEGNRRLSGTLRFS
jgi:hypothetical protein